MSQTVGLHVPTFELTAVLIRDLLRFFLTYKKMHERMMITNERKCVTIQKENLLIYKELLCISFKNMKESCTRSILLDCDKLSVNYVRV